MYHNLRSANAAPFYYGSSPYTDVAVYSSTYFHDGYAYGNAAPSTMVAAFTLKMLATPPLATPMLMVPDILPGISCFISIVYHNLKSANAHPSTMVVTLTLVVLAPPTLTFIVAPPALINSRL